MLATPATRLLPRAEFYCLWSLVDMERFYTGHFMAAVAQYSRVVGMLLEEADGESAPLDEDSWDTLRAAINTIGKTIKGIPLSEVIVNDFARLQSYAQKDSGHPQFMVKQSALYVTKGFLENLETELRTHLFLFVPSSRREMFTKPEEWFWGDMTARIRGAETDIEEACRCHALGRSTATVSHLMRAAEIGLRSLAKTANVTVKRKARSVPLLWADWQDLIAAIRAKKVTGMQTRRGPKRDAELDFYLGALGEFEAFKDVYRHHTMHARKSYTDPEAEHVMLYVRGFMRRLAPRIRYRK